MPVLRLQPRAWAVNLPGGAPRAAASVYVNRAWSFRRAARRRPATSGAADKCVRHALKPWGRVGARWGRAGPWGGANGAACHPKGPSTDPSAHPSRRTEGRSLGPPRASRLLATASRRKRRAPLQLARCNARCVFAAAASPLAAQHANACSTARISRALGDFSACFCRDDAMYATRQISAGAAAAGGAPPAPRGRKARTEGQRRRRRKDGGQAKKATHLPAACDER